MSYFCYKSKRCYLKFLTGKKANVQYSKLYDCMYIFFLMTFYQNIEKVQRYISFHCSCAVHANTSHIFWWQNKNMLQIERAVKSLQVLVASQGQSKLFQGKARDIKSCYTDNGKSTQLSIFFQALISRPCNYSFIFGVVWPLVVCRNIIQLILQT